MIDLSEYDILIDKIEPLWRISKDDSDPSGVQYMTSSTIEAINFDLVKRAYINQLGHSEEAAASVDAILPAKNGIIFVEFKNGKVNNRNVKDKVRDSLLIYLDIIGESVTFSRGNIDFIVVYNLEKNPLPNQLKKGEFQESPSRLAIADCFLSKAEKELIRFDLERYEGIYFRNVHTYTKEKFEEELPRIINAL